MKIKKNGVTINLTESDINKLRKSVLKEQQFGESEIYEGSKIKDLKEKLKKSLDDGRPVTITYSNSDKQYVEIQYGGIEYSRSPSPTAKISINSVCKVLP